MADSRQPEVTRSIRSWGLYSYKFVDAYKAGFAQSRQHHQKLVTPDEGGRFDMIAGTGLTYVFIELKNGEKEFAFKDFQENKRTWLKRDMAKFNISAWMFLILGTVPASYNRDKYPLARRAWLMPISRYFAAERLISPIQKSIPMLAGKGYNRTLQEKQWDAVHLFAKHELSWKEGTDGKPGNWELPHGHPFNKLFDIRLKEAA